MSIERETIVEPAASETVIVDRGHRPFGVIGAIIAAVAAVLLILWLMNGGVSSDGGSVNVDLPEITVTE
tara:strand:+ start:216 stop:422 length:207 start_codon:yes stop_codon:yes gene_type:complete